MLKSVVVDARIAGRKAASSIAWENTIIYEAHVKGLTQLRGTCGGRAAPTAGSPSRA